MAQSREALELDTMRRLIHQEIERLELCVRTSSSVIPPSSAVMAGSRTDFVELARMDAYREEIRFLRNLIGAPDAEGRSKR